MAPSTESAISLDVTNSDGEPNLRDNATLADSPFNGAIGKEYSMLRLICPAAADMSRQVGAFVRDWRTDGARCDAKRLETIEIGCGTGITTSALLAARDDLRITAIDIAPAMLAQARDNLALQIRAGRVEFIESDALAFLRDLGSASVDVVASGYAFHNFEQEYRRHAVAEVFRVLRPGGVFVNGDRFAVEDTQEQLRIVQEEIKHFFATFRELDRIDLLEQWIEHLVSDESPDHVMRFGAWLQHCKAVGFSPVIVHDRYQNNAVISAQKPLP